MQPSEFRKHVAEAGAAAFEAASLKWLGEASKQVAEVVDVGEHHIATVRVNSVRPTADAARQAGRELARIHAAGAPAFGAPPAGYEGPCFIGTQEQECTPRDTFAEFYPAQRVLPFTHAAFQAGNISHDCVDMVERACELIEEAELPPFKPARIHGDLWAGNLMFSDAGPIFIDPAAHGGHPVTDMAMLALFGAPFFEEIVAGYEEITALPDGWQETIPLHQLHPLAVHAYTHGLGYAEPLYQAAVKTIRLLEG